MEGPNGLARAGPPRTRTASGMDSQNAMRMALCTGDGAGGAGAGAAVLAAVESGLDIALDACVSTGVAR